MRHETGLSATVNKAICVLKQLTDMGQGTK
jgi:hypothetical protein